MFDFHHFCKAKIAHKEILCDNLTPLMALNGLKAKVLLESAYNETGKDRYSILILTEAFRVIKENGAYYLCENAKRHDLKAVITYIQNDINNKQSPISQNTTYDLLDSLHVVRSLSPSPNDIPAQFPLPLGGAGYIGYEFFAEIEDINFANPTLYDAPECAFIFGRDFLVFDHLFDTLYIVSVSYAYERLEETVKTRIKHIENAIKSLKPQNLDIHFASDFTVKNATKPYEYEQMVEKIKSLIYAGNLLQCVPSQYMQISSTLSPLQAYRNLRHQNPSPYMFYYDFDDFVVFGASPEIMLRLKTKANKSVLILRPIAGTRPRGANVAQDLELESELLNDEKEKAEHLMLVDLARNDAGKVSVGGSVKVVTRDKVERYSRVMHIVSQVESELDITRFTKRDAFKAVFPAGTLSGAPKIEAIKTIETLESHSRSIYGGAIGYFNYDEDMDFAIAIRTAVYQNGIYTLRAGAGVVFDSNPNKEYQETFNKMRSLLDMLGIKSDDL